MEGYFEMKRTVTYKGIKEIVYVVSEYDLNNAALKAVKETSFFVKSDKQSEFHFEWCDSDNGQVYLEITQKIIETEETKDDIQTKRKDTD